MKGQKAKKSGGTGFQPVQTFQITRRCLPHWQQPGSIYFITWRCKDGKALSPEERQIVLTSMQHWDGSKWSLLAAVVMPDHVHVLAQPLLMPEGGVVDLAEILHSVKSFTAHQINAIRETQGSCWQDESYDRIIRDEAEFLEKWNYIRNNPVKAELADQPESYPWLYERGN